MSDRFVVVGLAHVRSSWFTDVARWATMGAAPIEFVKCISAVELAARVDAGRRFSAAILDARLPVVDRELLDLLARRGVPAIVVDEADRPRDWVALGATTALEPGFGCDELVALLDGCAQRVSSVEAELEPIADPAPLVDRGPLVTVIGRSGAGTSTVAIAIAQALAAAGDDGREVLLADLALHAHQALLHDAGDVLPGLPELIDAHRLGRPTPDEVLDLAFAVPERGYRVLLGLRRHRDWVDVRARSLRAALDSLRSAADGVVADVTGDLEGEAETGSFDIEDRNALARTAVDAADLVVAVGRATVPGLHGLVLLLADLRTAGVPADRVLVVLNHASSRPRRRAELARSLAQLSDAVLPEPGYQGPAFVAERRSLDALHLTGQRLPTSVAKPLGATVHRLLHELGARAGCDDDPVSVVPGELSPRAG